ncbi:MAG TPA: ribonuclease E inhibitor RraB [Candidatus Dormibacteraeota bacterium]|jgi:hypothetical protein|nr:ribonuclease E inhibitor RraB [Candidatus Dormibacteraeota bacterium]
MSDWLGMIVPRALLQKRKPPRISLATPDPEDAERIEELKQRGSRMRLPHPVRSFLSCPNEKAANEASDALRQEGHRCRLRAEQDGSWTVIAIMHMVPNKGAITYLREEMTRTGRSVGGSYLGWESSTVL